METLLLTLLLLVKGALGGLALFVFRKQEGFWKNLGFALLVISLLAGGVFAFSHPY